MAEVPTAVPADMPLGMRRLGVCWECGKDLEWPLCHCAPPCAELLARQRACKRVRNPPEIDELLAEYRRGERVPELPEVPPLPVGASRTQRQLYDLMVLRWGLRLNVGDDRPLPLARSEIVAAGIVHDAKQASRLLHRLAEQGVIHHAETLPPHGYPNGTKCWLPGPKPVGALPDLPGRVKAAVSVGGTKVVVHPLMEIPDDASVSDAVAAGATGGLDGFAASADGAERESFSSGGRHVVGSSGGGYRARIARIPAAEG